jgi:hypothetical protein
VYIKIGGKAPSVSSTLFCLSANLGKKMQNSNQWLAKPLRDGITAILSKNNVGWLDRLPTIHFEEKLGSNNHVL